MYRTSNTEKETRNVCYIRFEVLTAVVMNSSILWDVIPCNPLKVNERFGSTRHLHLQSGRLSQARTRLKQVATRACFMLVSYMIYSSTLKMEATCPSETPVDFYEATQHYNPEVYSIFVCKEYPFKKPYIRWACRWHSDKRGSRAISFGTLDLT
jgi:hypothetical protein